MQPSPMPELAPYLKQLRLSGLLETLAERNREAIENKLSYPEFLTLLIQDEAGRREQKKYALRLRRAGFRGDKTLEGFDFAFNPQIDQQQITDLAGGAFIEEKVCVLIAGPCGTGKSHVAQALGHCAVHSDPVARPDPCRPRHRHHRAQATGFDPSAVVDH